MAGQWRYVAAKRRTDMSQAGDRQIWAESKRMEALTTYMATGSPSETAVQCNIPVKTIKSWMRQDWWKERKDLIQKEEYDKLDVKLTRALDKALDNLVDRIEHGDYIWDPKTGKVKQTPAKLRDLNIAFNTIMDKRQLIRKQPTKIVEQQSTAQQLQSLAEQFTAFVTGRVKTDSFNDLVDKVIEGETVEQQEDGTYVLKE